jgi:hypothetical protein
MDSPAASSVHAARLCAATPLTHSLPTCLAPTDRQAGRPPAPYPPQLDVGFLANRAGAQGVGAGVSATTIVGLELPRLPERLVGVAEAVLCGRAQTDR